MTRREASVLVAGLARRWPQAAERLARPGAIDGYRDALAVVGLPAAEAVVEAIHRDGREWCPNGGQILQKLADLLLDAPEWWQVKAALTGQSPVPDGAPELPTECPYGECDGGGLVLDWESNTASPCRCRAERQAIRRARRAQHPLVAEFVKAVGTVEVADLENRTAEAQVRQKWQAFVDGLRRQVTYHGLEPAGLPQLERMASEPRLSSGPRKLALKEART